MYKIILWVLFVAEFEFP